MSYTRLKHFCKKYSIDLKVTRYICDNQYVRILENVLCISDPFGSDSEFPAEIGGKTEKEALQAVCGYIRGKVLTIMNSEVVEVPYNIGL